MHPYLSPSQLHPFLEAASTRTLRLQRLAQNSAIFHRRHEQLDRKESAAFRVSNLVWMTIRSTSISVQQFIGAIGGRFD